MGLRNIFKGGIAALALGAAMTAFGQEFPSFGSRQTPTFLTTRERDGLGRRIKPKSHPNHNSRKRGREWAAFVEKVMLTHRYLPDGSLQRDPRDDKYLNSYARNMRAYKDQVAA